MSNILTVDITRENLKDLREKAELSEKQYRIFLGMLSHSLGFGGQKQIVSAFNVAAETVRAGRAEFEGTEDLPKGRVRREGAGRKAAHVLQPQLEGAINALLENNSYGDPERVLLWTTLSLRDIEEELAKQGFKVSHVTIGKIIERLGYSKQLNQKFLQVGAPHPDRDAQFQIIQQTVKAYLDAGDPVISIDCKKKELIGNFKNAGKEYRKKGDPRGVLDHDFPLAELGKVAPYGVYVLNDNTGFINLGKSSDTAEFAVESLRHWWNQIGKVNFPNAKRLLITCDGGGSNGCRVRLWKAQLAALAKEVGIEFMVCHFPPGTSKWNKIEHRLFCYISKNWEGKPLVDIKTTVNYIASTKTKTGLKVECRVDEKAYQRGLKVSDEEMDRIDLVPIGEFGKWNYLIKGFKPAPSNET